MKKTIFSFILLLVGVGMVNAQTAKQWLDKVYNKYQNAQTYYIKFDFEHQNKGNTQKNSGEVYSAKQKFNLNVDQTNQIFDGKKLYTVAKDEKEVVISNASNTEDFLTPTKVLNSYKTGYHYTLDKKQTIGGQPIQYIKLTPTTQNATMKYSVLGINTKNNQIYSYQEFGKDGAKTTITVKEYLENLIIHKDYFNFDQKKYKSKGYIVTQL
ncbi:MAG TPA: outer membrane lipoprotein carrier protein LolA [Faecalibacter sp.]|uniref:LolA family protein n=1 Tax=Faecalibacter sp. LW9 TaxID=3103144 RepID=UPI002AFDFA97|nr:outer membrane lipoprotein carrier protein LolA [Faecalibacter sp. LW9]